MIVQFVTFVWLIFDCLWRFQGITVDILMIPRSIPVSSSRIEECQMARIPRKKLIPIDFSFGARADVGSRIGGIGFGYPEPEDLTDNGEFLPEPLCRDAVFIEEYCS